MADENDKDSKNKDPKITDAILKIITAGGPTDISKELLSTVAGQVVKAKDDITLKASNEMIALIRKIDFVKEFSKFAENHKFKISAEIEILKKEDPKS